MKAIVLLFLLLFNLNLIGQSNKSDTISSAEFPRYKWLPKVEIFTSNILLNRFDLYILKAEWADVNPASWYNNIKSGFSTDGDKFGTNFFGHPLNGSYYFNAARSSGYSYWASIPHSLAGSLMWEFFGETEPASEIDINTTTYGGIYIGEIVHRLSRYLMRDHKSRKNKFLRTATATILDPMTQFNGWLHKDIRDSLRSSNQEKFPIFSLLSIGGTLLIRSEEFGNVHPKAHVNYSLFYGDLFRDKKKFKPFDTFLLRTWLDIDFHPDAERRFLVNIASSAPLWRKIVARHNVFTISQHYDYLNNDIFKIGSLALTADYSLKRQYDNFSFIGSANLGFILFGSSSSEVVQILNELSPLEFVRDYVYGRGVIFKVQSVLNSNNAGRLTLSYSNWRINIVKDASGKEASAIFQLMYYYPIADKIDLGFELFQYRRDAAYPEISQLENITKRYFEIKYLASIRF